jgi:hypothetical protein
LEKSRIKSPSSACGTFSRRREKEQLEPLSVERAAGARVRSERDPRLIEKPASACGTCSRRREKERLEPLRRERGRGEGSLGA